MLLEGVKVVELATWVAAPSCAAVMADWGADVIKIESPMGDATRAFSSDTPGGPGPIFNNENRGKKGVVLDTHRPEGRAALHALLRDADVFVTNIRTGSLKRLGLDYESLKAAYPRLIYAAVSGFGLDGPFADLPAFDMTAFWARSGAAHATIPPDQEPFPSRPGFGDHFTALATLSGVLAALHERHATGRGRLVEASLLRVGAYAMSWDLSLQLKHGSVSTAMARVERPTLTGFYRTSDGRWLLVLPRTLDCFANLMIALDRPEVVAEPRFEQPVTDMAVMRELQALCDAAFATFTLEDIGARLEGMDVAWSPMSTLAEMARSEEAEKAGCFVTIEDNVGGRFLAPASPIRFPEGQPPVTRPAPLLGQHTREILEAAGLKPEEIDAIC
jgi:crotonobetainyl-CoA:carnitine CoA-transferase CaiB-like acyl-CoA transferase